MVIKLSKKDALEFRERWLLANERIDQEFLKTPPEVKLKQLAALFEAAADFGWTEPKTSEVNQVWQRWKIIRESYAGSD